MFNDRRWYFTAEELDQVPSRKNFPITQDLSYRQQSACLIRDIGLKLKVTQQCINTAIVFMHRFYCHHPFKIYHRYHVAQAAIFLAAKVEYQTKKLMDIIATYRSLLNQTQQCDKKLPDNREIASTLIGVEEVLLSTIGFDLTVEHPHSYIADFCSTMKMPKNILKMCSYVATNTLLYTTLCVQYPPTVVACFCIHFVLKWSCTNQVQLTKNDKPWYQLIDEDVTLQLLETIFEHFSKTYKERSDKLIKIMKIEFAKKGSKMSMNISSNHDNTSSSSSSHSTSDVTVPESSTHLSRDNVMQSSSSSAAVNHQLKRTSMNNRRGNVITKMENSNSTTTNLPRDSTPAFKNFRFNFLAPEDTKPSTRISHQTDTKYNNESHNLTSDSNLPRDSTPVFKNFRFNLLAPEDTKPSTRILHQTDTKYNNERHNLTSNSNLARDSTAIEGFQPNLLTSDHNKPSTSIIGQDDTKYGDERYNLAGHSSWQKNLSITPTTSSSLSLNGNDSFALSTSRNLQKSSRGSNNFKHEETSDRHKLRPSSSSLNTRDSHSFTKRNPTIFSPIFR